MKNFASSGQDKRGLVPGISVVLCALSLSPPARAEHDGRVCDDPRVTVVGQLGAAWLEPVVALCEGLASMRDVDPSAQLRIVPAGGSVIVEAKLGDGRVGIRRVKSPADLRTTVEALVVLPPEAAEVHAPSPPDSEDTRQDIPAASTPAPEARALHVEIGAAGLAKVLGAPSYLSGGGEIYAGIRPGKFLLALTARWEPSVVPASGGDPNLEMSSVGVGFAIGRRLLPIGSGGLDAALTSTLVTDTQSVMVGAEERTAVDTDLWLGAACRALLGGPEWFFAPALVAELAPARLSHNVRLDDAMPAAPVWSAGIALGVTWGEP